MRDAVLEHVSDSSALGLRVLGFGETSSVEKADRIAN
jgi:hypothetical protein